MIACVLFHQSFGQIPLKPAPDPKLVAIARKYLPRDTPVRFMTSIEIRAGSVGRVRFIDNATLWTVFGSPTEFKIIRRDAMQDINGRSTSSVAVLWTEEGITHFWHRSESPSSDGATFKTGTEVWESNSSAPFPVLMPFDLAFHRGGMYESMIHTREQQILFGDFSWLAGPWTVTDSKFEKPGSALGALGDGGESVEWGPLGYFTHETRTDLRNDVIGSSRIETITTSEPMEFNHLDVAQAIRFVPPK